MFFLVIYEVDIKTILMFQCRFVRFMFWFLGSLKHQNINGSPKENTFYSIIVKPFVVLYQIFCEHNKILNIHLKVYIKCNIDAFNYYEPKVKKKL